MRRVLVWSWLMAAFTIGLWAQAASYQRATWGSRVLEGRGVAIRVLVEQQNLGSGEVEVAEITFPGGSSSGEHHHGATEILYIVSGRMDHVVNGESHVLEPGMAGIVRPGDSVVHRVLSAEPVKAVVVWTPGGEATRIAPAFTERPVE